MKKILLIFILFFATSFNFSFAQNSIEYEMVSYTGDNKDAGTRFFDINFFNKKTFTINYQSFTNAYQFFFDLIIGISIATSIILFMVAALKEIFPVGNTNSIKQGKEGMQNAIVGLIIILSTWLIINTINPDLLRLPIFSGIENLGSTSSGGPKTGVSGQSAGGSAAP